MEMDGTDYYPKPMNCPFHVMIYRSSQRSYRDLPMRLFELGAVYRYELSGAVHGLLRSRGFTQDDSHIFCAREHLASELASLLEFVLSVLEAFGFNDFQARLSTRPEVASTSVRRPSGTKPPRACGPRWNRPGSTMRPTRAAAPSTAPRSTWTCATPSAVRGSSPPSSWTSTCPSGSAWSTWPPTARRPRPVMIHRALFGSVERFFGVLLEHYAGAFPAWLAPVQAEVLPVAAAHAGYAAEVADTLRSRGFRTEVSPAEEPLGKRVRNAKVAKVPYVLVVGDDDTANGTVGVNARGASRDLSATSRWRPSRIVWPKR